MISRSTLSTVFNKLFYDHDNSSHFISIKRLTFGQTQASLFECKTCTSLEKFLTKATPNETVVSRPTRASCFSYRINSHYGHYFSNYPMKY